MPKSWIPNIILNQKKLGLHGERVIPRLEQGIYQLSLELFVIGNMEALKEWWRQELKKSLPGQIWASLSVEENNAGNES